MLFLDNSQLYSLHACVSEAEASGTMLVSYGYVYPLQNHRKLVMCNDASLYRFQVKQNCCTCFSMHDRTSPYITVYLKLHQVSDQCSQQWMVDYQLDVYSFFGQQEQQLGLGLKHLRFIAFLFLNKQKITSHIDPIIANNMTPALLNIFETV